MCFSAEASFTTAAVLSAIGTLTLKKTSSRNQLFLAVIPLFFALQQFSEGWVWLYLNQQIHSLLIGNLAKHGFLLFAFLIWPIWIPLSFLMVETIPWRRNILCLDLACGMALSIINLIVIFPKEIKVGIVNHSIQYLGHFPSQALIYPAIVFIPCFISSLRHVWLFGVLIALAYVIAAYFYYEVFISAWCFFAALVSIGIYQIIQDHRLRVDSQNEKPPAAQL